MLRLREGGVVRCGEWTEGALSALSPSTESYKLDGAGRVISGSILTTNPPNYPLPPTEQHEASYAYDDAGHLIARLLDGKTDFQARFDAAGRVLELTRGAGNYTVRWTYDGCGR
jgi:YD repeat-containing protein